MCRALLLSLGFVGVVLLAGCGSGDDSGSDDSQGSTSKLYVAAGAKPSTVDPLTTETEDGLELSRQIYEPLVGAVKAPRGDRRLNGLVLHWKHSRSNRVWLAWLRTGVRFQDGSKFDAQAVVRNGRRWIDSPNGQSQIPALARVSAPHNNLVRFVLDQPAENLPKTLASPRLGLVSPRALSRSDGGSLRLVRQERSGTGPFVLKTLKLPAKTKLTRNRSWWASERGIHPFIKTVVFVWQPAELDRVALLTHGKASVATDITELGVERLAGNPNIQLLGTLATREYATVRWLRGLQLSPLGAESFASVWITRPH